MRLQPLLDADRPDEAKVAAQLDLIIAARGTLDKDNALMMLAIRRVLSVEQWKKLQALQQEREGERGRPGPEPPPSARGPQPPRRPPADPPR
jgi:Spy/CpxP family protein refolding chaperone